MLGEFLLAFGTLFPIVNPVSTTLVFNAITAELSLAEKKELAFTASVTAALVLLVFALLGNFILSFFGITIYAFRVAGGLYLGKIAFEMLGKRLHKEASNFEDNPKDLALIPLAIPLLSGPGAITATLVLTEHASLLTYGALILAILAVCLTAWLFLSHAHVVEKALGHSGANAVEKILGLLVLVIAAQFIFNGVTGYLLELGILL